ncbi:WPP domain-associated protein-like isoform X2 [Dioscorea cayenensis subsp. rotundata]|nr:WPP domain-associated protein-like isoform X2 [Dioscorea cayenensis subsp. rotundata]
MEDSEALNSRLCNSVDGAMLASSSFKESDILGNDSALYEKFLLDDLDSYWDDLSARLTVSRMVGDSVIKGMVNAVSEEAAQRIALKEAEVAVLSDRLKCYEAGAVQCNRMGPFMMMPKLPRIMETEGLDKSSSELRLELDYNEQLIGLRIAVEKQLDRLTDDLGSLKCLSSGKANEVVTEIDDRVDALKRTIETVFKQVSCGFGSLMVSVLDSHWENEFQNEVNAMLVQDYIKDIYDKFETKLWEQSRVINNLNKKWQEKLGELALMREELDGISRSLLSSETGSLFSQNSLDVFEEWNNGKRKDHIHWKVLGNHHYANCEENGLILMERSEEYEKTMSEVADSPQIKGMTKEEVIVYYKTEMIKMRRQHDSALQEKTEELFSLKREFLKERGSLHLRKDKEFELLRKKIPDIILKLDGILQVEEKSPLVHDDQFHSLKERIDALYSENQHLRGLLGDKRKEVSCLSSQVSETASQMTLHSSAEASLLKQIKKLKCDIKDVNFETSIRDELSKVILRDFITQHERNQDDIEIEAKIVQEIDSIIFRGLADDCVSAMKAIVVRHQTESISLQQVISQKEKAICLLNDENGKLKQVVSSLTVLMEEKKRIEVETDSTLNQQKVRFDLLCQELCILKDKVGKQEVLISEKTIELDSTKNRLNEALRQIDRYEMDVSNLNQKVKNTSDVLEEAQKQNNVLNSIIKEKQKLLSSSEMQAERMDSVIVSLKQLSEQVADVENKMEAKIEQNKSRLKVLTHQCNSTMRQYGTLKKKELWYKKMLDIRYSNLQKAEAEVDLLGDEVDALLSLLGKIYIALDHYSPVLRHYPGVMEILKLVQRELKGENTKLM